MSVINDLRNHILVDGFHVVVDPKNSCGSWIVDKESGKKYLDCYSQFASQALGWNHSSLVAREDEIKETVLHKIANSDMYCEVYRDFVDAFASITPDFKHYFFIDGGALAVENALKAAFDWKLRKLDKGLCHPNKLDVIHFKNAFHGRTGYTMSLTNTDPMKTAGFPYFNWTRVDAEDAALTFDNNGYVSSYNNKGYVIPEWSVAQNKALEHVEAALICGKGNVAAIIIEPIQGEGGDNHFDISFFRELRELADEYEAMLIFDEVQTGMGMTGKMWCYEHFGIVPDMMCFGKKTQVCGFCSTDKIDDVADNVFHMSSRINSTWGGNVVDMARAKVIIDIIKQENLVENAKDVGGYLLSELRKLGLNNVRGRGLFIAFDCESKDARDTMMNKLNDNMLALKSGQESIRLRPHLTMTKDDADKVVGFMKDAL